MDVKITVQIVKSLILMPVICLHQKLSTVIVPIVLFVQWSGTCRLAASGNLWCNKITNAALFQVKVHLGTHIDDVDL